MKKLLQINTVVNYGSTGRIARDIGDIAMSRGWESVIAYGRKGSSGKSKLIKIGSKTDNYLHVAQTRFLDQHGFGSKQPTRALVRQIQEIDPDVVHLHNLHGYYLNYKILFEYLEVRNKPIVWTLHDCWTFTGHCCYFSFAGCEKWKTECHQCPQKSAYPSSIFLDNSKNNFQAKKKYFGGIKNLTLVPVSHWLKGLLQESYLQHHPIEVIHNGVDVETFKPQESDTSIASRYGLDSSFVILGVANTWDDRKGLKDFLKLNEILGSDERIVLVGLSENQCKNLPEKIIGIQRTDSVQELAALYSAADVFFNATYEDNFPTTNLEAMACGTAVITYRTGGSIEPVTPKTGFIVDQGDIDEVHNIVKHLKEGGTSAYIRSCSNHIQTNYEKQKQYLKYFDLYNTLLGC